MASQKSNHDSAETKAKPEKQTAVLKRGIRNPFIYVGTIVILVITIIAFVFIPSIGGGIASGGVPSFGSWDGQQITYKQDSYFATQVSTINDYLRQQGLSEQNFQLYAYQVWQMAFQSTAVRMAVIDSVKKSGYKVTNAALDEAMSQEATFQVDGKFSLEKYNGTPLATRLKLRQQAEEDIYVRRYFEDMYTISPSTAEIEFVASIAKPQRDIEYVSIPLSGYPDAELASWGGQNAKLFRTLALSRVTVTSSKSDAEKILAQVRDNTLSFEDAAKSHSQDAYASQGGDAGTVFFHTFAQDFSDEANAEAIAGLAKGDISDVYELGANTWAFFRLNAATSQPDFSKRATLDEVHAYLFDKERGVLESWAIAKANKLIGAADVKAFQSAAKSEKLEIKQGGPYTISIGNPTFYAYNQQIPLFQAAYGSQTSGIPGAESDEAFITELFSLEKGKISKPLLVGDEVVVFAVTGATEGGEDETALVKFAYPYFHQQNIETQARTTFLGSKKFKDNFSATFFKLFSTSGS